MLLLTNRAPLPTLPLARLPLLPRVVLLALVLRMPVSVDLRAVLRTLAWVVLRMQAWEVPQMQDWEALQALQATSEVVPTRVQADLRVLRVAQDFLTSVPLLEVQLKAMPMRLLKPRLLLKPLVQSAPVLRVRAMLVPDLVARLLALLVMALRRVQVRLLGLELVLEPELVLQETLE